MESNEGFSIELKFSDLSDEGIEKFDQELQQIVGFSVAELEDEDETPLLGLRFFMNEEGKIQYQYYPPKGSPDPYEVIIDLIEAGEYEPDYDTISVALTWDDIHPATKQTIREQILANFNKRKYVFDDSSYIGTAYLDISNYID